MEMPTKPVRPTGEKVDADGKRVQSFVDSDGTRWECTTRGGVCWRRVAS